MFIHITTTNLMEQFMGEYAMILAHKLVEPKYFEIAKKVGKKFKILDNSFYELGYALPTDELVRWADKIDATHIVAPDGSLINCAEISASGYKTIFVPTNVTQFIQALNDPSVDMIGLSEEHFTRRYDPFIRYDVLNIVSSQTVINKPIHILGVTDTIMEIALLSKFAKHIHSMDSSYPFWAGKYDVNINEVVSRSKLNLPLIDWDESVILNDTSYMNICYTDQLWDEFITRRKDVKSC